MIFISFYFFNLIVSITFNYSLKNLFQFTRKWFHNLTLSLSHQNTPCYLIFLFLCLTTNSCQWKNYIFSFLYDSPNNERLFKRRTTTHRNHHKVSTLATYKCWSRTLLKLFVELMDSAGSSDWLFVSHNTSHFHFSFHSNWWWFSEPLLKIKMVQSNGTDCSTSNTIPRCCLVKCFSVIACTATPSKAGPCVEVECSGR